MVREVEIPAGARALATLPRLDYTDCHLVDVAAAPRLSGERWARVFLEEAPGALRTALRSGWAALGLKLRAAEAPDCVLGWPIRHSDDGHLLLAAESSLGFAGELLVKPEDRTLLFATLLEVKNPAARATWASIAPGHRRVVRHVLERGAQRQLAVTTQ